MKKIVALVLCLALALSLCTVAFAAATSTGSASLQEATTATIYYGDYKTEKVYDAQVGGNKYTTRYTLFEKVNGNYIPDGQYVVTDDVNATLKLIDGSKITYLMPAADYTKALSLVSTVDYTEADACHEMFTHSDAAVYKDSAGNYYLSDATPDAGLFGSYNDMTIGITAVVPQPIDIDDVEDLAATNNNQIFYIAHELKVDTDDKKNDVEYVSAVECKRCGKLDFVTSFDKAVTTFGDGNFVTYLGSDDATAGDWFETDIDTILTSDALYIKGKLGVTVAAAADSSSTTVESAKTFDAGIALYAGMALASVAGSAVVIGKKKEF